MFFNPLEQFEVVPYFTLSILGFDFSLTNSGFYMFAISTTACLLFFFSFFYSYVFSSS